MHWIRSHLSFANVISVMALFVALGGTSFAAIQLAKNSVGAKQIKKNAVRVSEVNRNAVGASEIRSNAVASGDIADNGVGGADLADNSVGSGEMQDNSVGSGEVTDNSLGATDIDGATLDGEIGPDAFARVDADGTLSVPATGGPFPPVDQQKGITPAMISHTAGTGRYCFGDLPFVPRSAMISTDGRDAGGINPVIAAVTTTRGTALVSCPAPFTQVRVEMTQIDPTVDPYAAPVAVDKAFYLWLEK